MTILLQYAGLPFLKIVEKFEAEEGEAVASLAGKSRDSRSALSGP